MAAVNTKETLKELSIEISLVRMELTKQNFVIISFKKHKLGSALGDPFKVTLENWIFLRNDYLIYTVYYLKVTLENWIFLRNGYLIDTVYCLKVTLENWIFLRNGYLIDTVCYLKVTVENWIFLRNGHLIDTVCYLKVTLENWIFLRNGYLIDTVYCLNPLRPGVHLSVQNLNCCWLGTGPVEYFCCAGLLQVVGIEHFYIQMHCGNTSCDLSTWLLHQRFL